MTHGLAVLGWVRVAGAAMATVASIIGLLAAGGPAYMIAQGISAAIFTPVLAVLAVRRVVHSYGNAANLPRGAAKGSLGFTVRSSLATTVGIGTDNLPLTSVGVRGGLPILAEYRIALASSRLISSVFSPISAVRFPMLSRDAAQGGIDRIRSRSILVRPAGGCRSSGNPHGLARSTIADPTPVRRSVRFDLHGSLSVVLRRSDSRGWGTGQDPAIGPGKGGLEVSVTRKVPS